MRKISLIALAIILSISACIGPQNEEKPYPEVKG